MIQLSYNLIKTMLIVISIYLPTISIAVDESKLELLSLDIQDYRQQQSNSVYWMNNQNLKLHARQYLKGSNTALVIFPGLTEPEIKYSELAYDLKNIDVDLHILDHQGHGFSETTLSDPDIQKIHIDKFSQYEEDSLLYINTQMDDYDQIYGLGHSMGSHILLRTMLKEPKLFESSILVAPMLEIPPDLPELLAHVFYEFQSLGWNILPGFKKASYNYAPGKGPWRNILGEDSSVTNSIERHNWIQNLYGQSENQSAVRGGPTNKWVAQAIKSNRWLRRQASKIETPFLILQAENELVVRNSPHNKFCNLALICELITIPKTKHEILMEKDEARNEALNFIKAMLLN